MTAQVQAPVTVDCSAPNHSRRTVTTWRIIAVCLGVRHLTSRTYYSAVVDSCMATLVQAPFRAVVVYRLPSTAIKAGNYIH